MQKYKLGDPTNTEHNLGPVCSVASAERIRKQIADAGKFFTLSIANPLLTCSNTVKSGAKALIPEDLFPVAKACVPAEVYSTNGADMFNSGTAFVAPQVLVDVNHCESRDLVVVALKLIEYI